MKNGDSTKRIVIVIGYSNGNELARKLLDRKGGCIHANSPKRKPARISLDPPYYEVDLGHAGSVGDAIAKISPLGSNAVIAGSEHAVDFAEAVANVSPDDFKLGA